MYWFASDLGAAGRPGPLHVQVISDLAGEPNATEKMLRVLNHELRPSELFTPRLLGRALARTLRQRPGEIPELASELTRAIRSELGRRRARRSPLRRPPSASAFPGDQAGHALERRGPPPDRRRRRPARRKLDHESRTEWQGVVLPAGGGAGVARQPHQRQTGEASKAPL